MYLYSVLTVFRLPVTLVFLELTTSVSFSDIFEVASSLTLSSRSIIWS